MNIETWYKVYCPACSASNWICDGDTNDITVPDIEAMQCHACSKKFAFDEEYLAETYDFEDEDAEAKTVEEWLERVAYITKGSPRPK